MSKLVVSESVTVDGIFEDPGGGEAFDLGGWAFSFDRGPVDEYRLTVLPTVPGHGKRLFAGASPPKPLRLVATPPAGETLILTYRAGRVA